MDPPEIPVAGVHGLEHTADVGLVVEAPDLSELFRRGALGAMWLVLDRPPGVPGGASPTGEPRTPSSGTFPDGQETRTVELVEEDLPALFRSWLRLLLFWEETEGFVTWEADLSFTPVPLCSAADGLAFGLVAQVRGILDSGPRVREIKGVTLHGLEVRRVEAGWQGRVIFDV